MSIFPAISFVTQVLSFLDCTNSNQQKQSFISRVRGSFGNPNDLRGMLFEFSVATHFIQRGYEVSWQEGEATGPSVDLLVHGIGDGGLEIECKSFSPNIGRKILTREALEFFNMIRPHLNPRLRAGTITGGVSIVVTVADRLPKSYSERKTIAKKAIDLASIPESNYVAEGYSIEVSSFDTNRIDQHSIGESYQSFRTLIDSISNTDNRETMVYGDSERIVLVVLQSGSADSVLRKIFDTLKNSARKQPSKTKAVAYMVEFSSVGPKELSMIANQDSDTSQPPTGLRVAVSGLLNSPNYNHIVGLGFFSDGSINKVSDGSFQNSGTSYFFPHRESQFWHDDYGGLFNI